MMLTKRYYLNWMTADRGHDKKLFEKRFRLDVRKFALGNRVVNDWNSLSSQCVNCSFIHLLYMKPT